MDRPHLVIGAWLPLLALIALGCGKPAQIESYRVPKPATLARSVGNTLPAAPSRTAPAAPQRMLSAIMMVRDHAWVFRLVGSPDAVAGQAESFDALVKSVRFADDKPRWVVPAGWTEEGPSGLRHATLRAGEGATAVELSITRLERGDESDEEYALANVNRWRGQLSLPSIDLEQLDAQSRQIEVAGIKTRVVELTGMRKPDEIMRPAFASPSPSAPSLPAESNEKPTFDVPPGWAEAPPTAFSKAAFRVEAGGEIADITVSVLTGQAGDLLANVNRWRGQVGLEPTTAEQLAPEVKRLEMGDETADYVALAGPKKTLLGAVLPRGEKTWFIKILGDAPLVERERERFEAFVRSLRFSES